MNEEVKMSANGDIENSFMRHASLIDLSKMNYPEDSLLTEDSLEHLSFLVLEEHFCQMPKGQIRNQFPFNNKSKWKAFSSWIERKTFTIRKFRKYISLRRRTMTGDEY